VQTLAEAPGALELAPMVVGLLGGLAIFLTGMDQMTDALKAVAGGGMRAVLARLTRNRFAAAATGALVTVVIQSSSITTVLVVGFVSAGVMTLQQSIGVILGANIGTTVTAQIIAFHIDEYALGMIAAGFFTAFVGRVEAVRQVGRIVMGLGVIFLGMGLMSGAMAPLRTHEPFVAFMATLDDPLLAVAVSAAFTALVQSSSATTGIVIVLAGQGFITLEAGIALALGANIGTCVTAMLATLGNPRIALRAALVHVVFNVVGVLVWVFLIAQLAEVVRWISPSSPGLEGAERLAAETPRQIANAHTVFNVANTLVFIWLTRPLAWLVTRLAPDQPEVIPEGARPRFLSDAFLDTPAIALNSMAQEVARVGDDAAAIVRLPLSRPDAANLSSMRSGAKNLDRLHGAIVAYGRRLLSKKLTPRESAHLEALLSASDQLHAISDTASLNVRTILKRWRKRGLRASDETTAMFDELVRELVSVIESVAEAIRTNDAEAARAIVALKPAIVARTDAVTRRVTARLAEDDEDRVEIYRQEIAAIELLRRIFYFTRRAARAVAGQEAEPDRPPPSPRRERQAGQAPT
jgi:phosphate:Na+ symporter